MAKLITVTIINYICRLRNVVVVEEVVVEEVVVEEVVVEEVVVEEVVVDDVVDGGIVLFGVIVLKSSVKFSLFCFSTSLFILLSGSIKAHGISFSQA